MDTLNISSNKKYDGKQGHENGVSLVIRKIQIDSKMGHHYVYQNSLEEKLKIPSVDKVL